MISAYVRFWDQREPVGPLAAVRLLVGAVLLFDLLQAWYLGLVPDLWAPFTEGGLGKLYEPKPGEWLFWTPTTESAWVLWGVTTAAAATFLLGLATPVSCAVLIFGTAQLGHLSPKSDVGIDILLRWALLILLFSRCGATWSLDAWLRRRRVHRPWVEAPAWPRYLLIGQLLLLYLSAGIAKAHDRWTPWGGAYAVYLVMWDPTFSRFSPEWLSWGFPITQVMTVATLFWELSSPLVLLSYWAAYPAKGARTPSWRRWLGRFRLLYIAMGIGFHVALMVTLRLGVFAHGVLALYPAFFHQRELAALVSAVRNRWFRSLGTDY
jgi:hypothetical protein